MFFIICRYRTIVMHFKETFASVTRPSTCRFSASSSVSSIEATNRVFSAVYTALWMSRACRKKNRGKNLISKSLPRISLIISIQTLFLDCRLRRCQNKILFNELYNTSQQYSFIQFLRICLLWLMFSSIYRRTRRYQSWYITHLRQIDKPQSTQIRKTILLSS